MRTKIAYIFNTIIMLICLGKFIGANQIPEGGGLVIWLVLSALIVFFETQES